MLTSNVPWLWIAPPSDILHRAHTTHSDARLFIQSVIPGTWYILFWPPSPSPSSSVACDHDTFCYMLSTTRALPLPLPDPTIYMHPQHLSNVTSFGASCLLSSVMLNCRILRSRLSYGLPTPCPQVFYWPSSVRIQTHSMLLSFILTSYFFLSFLSFMLCSD